MTRVARLSFLAIFLLPALIQAQIPAIEYKIGMSKPWTHLLEVELSFAGLPPGTASLDFQMPIWRTGRYVVFDFPSGVQEFSALDGSGSPLPWAKTDKSTWKVKKGRATAVSVRYKVYANEFDQRTRGLNDEHAFVDGCAVFMYLQQYRSVPIRLTVIPFQDWHVTTGLETVRGEANKFLAPNYDFLADAPLEIGSQKDYEFEAEGKKHVISIYGPATFNMDNMIADFSKLIKANKEFWGDLPYDRYVFMFHTGGDGGGATEHMNSTIIQLRSAGSKDPLAHRGLLGVTSHEYFHTWNVKQLRPKNILPYDFTKENYVKELWVAEGTTSYYTGLLLNRAGLGSPTGSLDMLARTVQEDRQRPGNRIQPVAEASFDSWVKGRGTQQSYNAESDFYGKGSTVSLVLDLEIRHRSNNKYSLDDVMRALYKRFPLSGGVGYTNEDLQSAAEKLAGSSLAKIFEDHVYGAAPVDWERLLLYAGLELRAKDAERKPDLGLQAFDRDGKLRVVRVLAGSAAEDAGIDVGDEIIAFNGGRISQARELTDRLANLKADDKVRLTFFRRDRLREIDIPLRLQSVPAYSVTKTANPTALQKSIYESWLGTTW